MKVQKATCKQENKAPPSFPEDTLSTSHHLSAKVYFLLTEQVLGFSASRPVYNVLFSWNVHPDDS